LLRDEHAGRERGGDGQGERSYDILDGIATTGSGAGGVVGAPGRYDRACGDSRLGGELRRERR